MNPKIQKTAQEIEKLKRKISDNQARLRDLERQKLELENADIVAAVRAIDVAPDELAALIGKLQKPSGRQAEPAADKDPAVGKNRTEDLSIEN